MRFTRKFNNRAGRFYQDCEETSVDEAIHIAIPIANLEDLQNIIDRYEEDIEFREYVKSYDDYKYYIGLPEESRDVPETAQEFYDQQLAEMNGSPKMAVLNGGDKMAEINGGPKMDVMPEDPNKVETYCRKIYNINTSHYNEYDLYAVITPYWERKGMSMVEVDQMIRKRWSPKRYMITYEDRDKHGNPINPHYNVLFSSAKLIKSYNNNQLNVKVRFVKDTRSLRDDYDVLINYMFKTYHRPYPRPMYLNIHYIVWSKYYMFRLVN